MGTGLGSKAVVEVTKEKSVRVDGVIIDSPFHSFEYALEKMPNFYYYSSFFIDWSKFLEVAGLKVHTANVSSIRVHFYNVFNFWIFLSVNFLLQNIAQIECPVTILHAKNDKVCPIEGSEKILEDAKKSGKTNIKLVKFQEVGPEGNGHIGISKHEDFDEVIKSAVLDAHNYHEIKE